MTTASSRAPSQGSFCAASMSSSGADGFYESVFESMRLVPPARISEPARTVAPAGEAAIAAPPTAEAELLRAVGAGMALVAAYRSAGHLAAPASPPGGGTARGPL